MLTYQQIIEKIDQLEEAHILIAALELRIFSILGKAKLTARQVAGRAGTSQEGTEPLLNALVAMGALGKQQDRFKNTPETYKHFCESSPHFKKGLVALRTDSRREWEKLWTVVREGRDLSEYEGGDDPEFRRWFTHAMHERSRNFTDPVARAVARKRVGRMIDLGGGPGSYSAAILKRDKKARAVLLDRPAAIHVARELHERSPIAKRLEFREGDLFETDFDNHFDTVLFSNILHIYNPKENKKLFRKIHRCLVPGGRFVLVDLFLKENRTEPYDAALFSLTMLLFTATGKTYTFQETQELLKTTGFGKVQKFRVGKGSSLLEAVKV